MNEATPDKRSDLSERERRKAGEDSGTAGSMSQRFRYIINRALARVFSTDSTRSPEPEESSGSPAENASSTDAGKGRLRQAKAGRYDGLLDSFLHSLDDRSGEEPSGEPTLAKVLLHDAWDANASDIHLDSDDDGVRLRMRIDGILLDIYRLDQDDGRKLINQFKALAHINPDTMLTVEEGRFTQMLENDKLDLRVLAAPCINGPKLTIRLLVRRQVEQRLQDLGMRKENRLKIENILESMSGMFLAAGPTGSGKTTTIYAMLHKLKDMEGNIVTIEDPVEYSIEGVNQVQVDEQHDLDMAYGGKALLRLDPDCLVLGEIRDADSAWTAFNAAASGRILLSTIHSHEAVGVVSVLRNYGITNQDIAANLSFVVAQRLVRALCRKCREERRVTDRDRRWFSQMNIRPPKKAWYPKGCEACNNIGYQGRTGVFEVWKLQDRDYEMILKDNDVISMRRTLHKSGHKNLTDEALIKLEEGRISPLELRAISGYGPLIRR